MTTRDDEAARYIRLCRAKAIHSLGTSYIFQKRAKALKLRLTIINYVGAVVPVIVGAMVLSFDIDSWDVVKIIAGVILLPQAAFNLWSIFGGWVEALPYANTSAAANDSLSVRFDALATAPPIKISDFRQAYEKLEIEDKARRDLDTAQHPDDAELRMGMRYALRKFEYPCASCGLIPKSMKPSNCDVCGNFKHSDR